MSVFLTVSTNSYTSITTRPIGLAGILVIIIMSFSTLKTTVNLYIYYLNLFIILITQQKQINKTHLFIILPSVEVSAASVTRRKYLNIISYKTVIFSCAYTCIQCKFAFRKSMNQTSITI